MKKFFLLGILSLFSLNSFSYVFTTEFTNGIYWQTFPIPITVVANSTPEAEELYNVLVQSSGEWESAAGDDMWQISSNFAISYNPGGNVVRWATDFEAETGFDSGSTLAVAIRYQSGPYYAKTEIIINENLPNITSWGRDALYRVVLHELGHTIGLDHTNEFGIMAPYISSNEDLQADDIQGVIEAVGIHRYRQSIGYVSPYTSDWSRQTSASESPMSCATIDIEGSDGGNGNGGGGNAVISLIFGLLVAFQFKLFRKFLPVHLIQHR